MIIRFTVVGEAPDSQLRELHSWLRADDAEWRPVRLVEREPPPGALGPVADAVEIVLESVSSLSSLAGVVIAWLQYRDRDVRVTIADRRRLSLVQVGAEEVQDDTAGAAAGLTAQLEKVLGPGIADDGQAGPGRPGDRSPRGGSGDGR